jgi:hypothetical protein
MIDDKMTPKTGTKNKYIDTFPTWLYFMTLFHSMKPTDESTDK